MNRASSTCGRATRAIGVSCARVVAVSCEPMRSGRDDRRSASRKATKTSRPRRLSTLSPARSVTAWRAERLFGVVRTASSCASAAVGVSSRSMC
jgi:hypothetical protein